MSKAREIIKLLQEAKPKPISTKALESYLRKLVIKKVLTKERYTKYSKEEYGDISYKDWLEFELSPWFTFEGSEQEIEFGLYDTFFGVLLGLSKIKGNESKVISLFDKLIYKVGWYVSAITYSALRVYLKLRPLYGEIVSVKRYLYHFTTVWNKDSILRKGLIPRQGKRSYYGYPPRVFLLTKYSKSDLGELRLAVASYGASAEDYYYGNVDIEPIVVFKVDTTKLRKGTKFFKDPDHLTSVWTSTHIPSTALSVVYEEKE